MTDGLPDWGRQGRHPRRPLDQWRQQHPDLAGCLLGVQSL